MFEYRFGPYLGSNQSLLFTRYLPPRRPLHLPRIRRTRRAKKNFRRNDVDDDAVVLVDDNDVVREKTKRKTEEGAMAMAMAVSVAVAAAAAAAAVAVVVVVVVVVAVLAATAVAMKEERRRALSEDDGLN